jgi:hypothetical protein
VLSEAAIAKLSSTQLPTDGGKRLVRGQVAVIQRKTLRNG